MENYLALVVGLYFTASVYLLLSESLIRMLIGVALLGNGVNLLIFTAGRITREVPPIIPEGQKAVGMAIANPLPQALILTAIVISFALFAFVLVLAYRSYETIGTDDTAEMRLAEPVEKSQLPKGY
ncbi:MAG: cation:proton antiporter [Rhodomicrobium sp.]|nr:MAG: cation:proton antiporter [Rhodomicrobium sp.]